MSLPFSRGTGRPAGRFRASSGAACVMFGLLAAACGGPLPPPNPAPTPATPPVTVVDDDAPPLPPVPLVEGPLRVSVVYPPAQYVLAARDSNFIFGNVGNGRASLTINGQPVRVHPNGAFLGWVANPPRESPVYRLVATTGTDTARADHSIRYAPPREALPTTGRLQVDSASVQPSAAGGALLLRGGESVRVSVRAPANAQAWLMAGTQRVALTPRGEAFGVDVPAAALASGAQLFVVRGTDTTRLPVRAVEQSVDSLPRWVRLVSRAAVPDSDQAVIARPLAGETYRWTLLPGTVLRATGIQDGWTRVRLDTLLEAWVANGDTELLPAGSVGPGRRVTGNVRIRTGAEWSDVVIPLAERPAHFVELGERTLTLTLYGTRGNTDLVQYATRDTFVRRVEWAQELPDRVKYTVHLGAAPYGWLVLHDGASLVLRLRHPPAVQRRHPLRGLTIAVDAGHPPGGAVGPTGLREPEVTLQVAEALRRMLEERGARVVMTRTTMDAVDLNMRGVMARRGGAHAFVSIHFDALPDGINPLARDNGTSAFFYRGHSEPLARAVKAGLNRNVALPDGGVWFRSLAVVRPTWVPSVLAEGAFMMIPEQESALRDERFRARIAHGILVGLEEYFAGMVPR